MKVLAKMLLVAGVVIGLISAAMATTDEAQSTVTITFSEISELAVSGNPGLLTIDAPTTAGTLPAEQEIAGTTMSWTSNVATGNTRKITGSLATLFEGIDLYATVAASGGTGDFGSSAGPLKFAIAATAYNFVTGIGNGYITAQTITFKATPTAMVTPYTETAKVVTWTLTDDAV